MDTFAGVNTDLFIELFGVSSTPSHDTFARIFRILDKKLFALCLQKFSEKIDDIMARHVVAIDGKTSRRARAAPRKAAHIISAWSLGEKLLPKFACSEKKAMKFQRFRNFLIFWGRR